MLKKILFYSKEDGINDKEIILNKFRDLKEEILEIDSSLSKKIEEVAHKENKKIYELEEKIEVNLEKNKKEVEKIKNTIYTLLLNNLNKDKIENL